MRITLSIILFTGATVSGMAADDAQATAYFEKHIRPVLVEHCYKCHSSESEDVKGGLLLDSAPGMLRGGDSGPAVIPGKPSESLLLSAIRYESFEMPPDSRLSEQTIARFEHWIAAGAVDPRTSQEPANIDRQKPDIAAGRRFWAFQRPQPATLPVDVAQKSLNRRIDYLVKRSRHRAGLQGNSRADRRTLLRRLSFTLTGLPPTPQEMDSFLSDPGEDAFDRAVDRLLNSPAYGERWARMWLDVSRYAEDQAHIVGNNKELFYPNAWMYRDWVINALNSDMPYDRFIQLQLAADLIEPDNETHLPALGFIGLGPKYYRRNDPAVMADEWEDRVDVVSRGLLGLTIACARCHDHKYDPIRTEDYYALAGVFASTQMYNRPLRDTADRQETQDGGKAASKKKITPDLTMHVVKDATPRDLHVMIRGNVDQRGELVKRGFPAVLCDGPPLQFASGSGRAELASAIASPNNPLTARVIVNRIWKEHFGRGIVSTLSNFGELGERPVHQELLDELAVEFMNHNWSLKWLHRQIVRTDVWQQASDISSAVESDPENRWLWRMPRRRLSVEQWRDAVLLTAGRLDRSVGGPSIQPDDPKQTRRTVYAAVSRFELNPLLARFDFPDPNVHAAGRVETTTPLQKLFLLNSPFVTAQSKLIAERASQGTDDLSEKTRQLYRLTLQREPTSEEVALVADFVKTASDPLPLVAQNLIAGNEFWYVD